MPSWFTKVALLFGCLLLEAASMATIKAGASSVMAANAVERMQPLVNPRVDVLEAGSVAAKLAGSRQRAVAGLLRSRSAKARSNELEMQVQQLVLQSQTKTAVLKDMSALATLHADKADIASSNAVKAFERMEAEAPTWPARAKELAVAEVQKLFTSSFEDLLGWREQVLRDPHADAKLSARKAAQPYKDMQNVFVNRMQAYAAEAKAAAVEANTATAKAGDIAREAQRKQEAGDTLGASQDMGLAKATVERGQQLAEYAKALQASAEGMNKQTGLYISAEHAATARAQYDADPESLPPLPLDPHTAYTPPPPAAL